MKTIKLLSVSIFIFSFLTITLQAQVVGKIFTKSEANTLFGSVIESKVMSVTQLKEILEKTNNYVMFYLKDGVIAIKGDGGNLIYNEGTALRADDVFMKYSKSIVKDLLMLNEVSPTVVIERRSEVISITFGNFTLELSMPCPPFCGG